MCNLCICVTAAPTFAVRPLAQTLLLGNTLLLECEGRGTPKPMIMWFLNDTKVSLAPHLLCV